MKLSSECFSYYQRKGNIIIILLRHFTILRKQKAQCKWRYYYIKRGKNTDGKRIDKMASLYNSNVIFSTVFKAWWQTKFQPPHIFCMVLEWFSLCCFTFCARYVCDRCYAHMMLKHYCKTRSLNNKYERVNTNSK